MATITASTDRLIEKLQGEITALRELAEGQHTAALDEDRDLVDAERAIVDQAKADIESRTVELSRLTEYREAAAATDSLLTPRSRPSTALVPQHSAPPVALSDMASLEEARDFRSGTMSLIEMPEQFPVAFAQARATLVSTVEPYASLATTYTVNTGEKEKPRPLLAVCSRVGVSASVIQVLTVTNPGGAAVVAEGALKPEVTWTETLASIPLSTIAGHKKATRQVLSDVTYLRSLIDTQLRRAVLDALEAEVNTVLGSAFTAGNTTTITKGAGESDSDALMRGIRVGLGEVQARGHIPNAVLINPADWAGLDIALLGQTLLGPVVGNSLWGLTIVAHPSTVAGTAVVGDFSEGIGIFEKAGLQVYVTDSDISGEGATAQSDFRRNILTFLAELYARAVITDASALEKIEVSAVVGDATARSGKA
jgi:HK97 family phage major capsid protein